MRITLLGTGTSQGVPIIGCNCKVCTSEDPRDQRLRTAALVEVDGQNILIDAGPDLRQQLLRSHTTTLRALLLTHEHKDHTAGLDDVRPINFLMKQSLNIYGMARVLKVIRKDYDYAFNTYKYPGVPELILNPIHSDQSFWIDEVEIVPIKVHHMTLPILGYRIRNLAYITDASMIGEKEKEKLFDLDLLVVNALRIEEHYSHFNLAQALALIKEVQPRKAMITHIGHEMGLYEEVSKLLPSNVMLGYDGLTMDL
ncbi:MAG: MBL fold metallo-hydrolase [Bacteroidales bacterium]|nr:MBL fold metallo-hydrolase [Bacteroidales bacterium]